MKTLIGNLLNLAEQGKFDVIVQGCNCFCTMGAGLAKQIKERYPAAYKADCYTVKGDRSKLGTFTHAKCKMGQYDVTIVNAYTQYEYWGTGDKADYNAIRNVFKLIKQRFHGARFGVPMIGAGLAGGDWNRILGIIREELNNEDVTIIHYKR